MSSFESVERFFQSKNINYKVESQGRELRTICPFCKNPKQKCYVHSGNGCFNCFHCGQQGSWKTLVKQFGSTDAIIPSYDVKEEDEPDLPPIDPEYVEECHQRLLSDMCKPIREYLHKKRGYSDLTIKKFKLGWDEGRNIIIPIFDSHDNCLNFKKRPDPTSPSTKKTFYSIPGRGRKRLFNEVILKEKLNEVFILEGEWDCIRLCQEGFAAVTSTAGAGSFDASWVDFFSNIENIFICYDNDRNGAGQRGAEKTAELFYRKGITVKIVNLPKPKGIEQKIDITDFLLEKGEKASEAFSQLLRKAKEYKSKSEETPQHVREKQPLLSMELTYSDIEAKVLRLLPGAATGLKIILAVSVSACFRFPAMIWLLLVDVPSSGKTDLVRLVRDAEFTYYLDNLTQNAFISGERATKSQKVYDLLPLLDGKCFVVKDWTSIFSLDEKMTKKLLGDLVNIYDKEFAKFSSRRGNVTYESAFSHLGCVTPATLNKHSTYMNMVGARFLCYTMPVSSPEDEAKSFDNIFSEKIDRAQLEREARKYVSSYVQQLSKRSLSIKPFSKEVEKYLSIAAKFVASCRGIIILQNAEFQNAAGEKIRHYETIDVQIEKPWRALQQLIALAQCLTFIVGKDEVEVEELRIIKEVVISSMPADRAKALRSMQQHGKDITAKELSDLSETSIRTSRRLLDELAGLKVLIKISGSGSMATDYKMSSTFGDFICNDPAEFLSSYSHGTENPQGIQEELLKDVDK